jgi:hypothetical protein
METSLYFADRFTSAARVIYDVYLANYVNYIWTLETNDTNNENKNNENNENENENENNNEFENETKKCLNPLKRHYPKNYVLTDYFGPLYKPTHIIDNIYVGSSFNAASFAIMEEFNFKYIINVTKNIPNYHSSITYFNIPIEDNNNDLIDEYLIPVYNKILEYQEKNDGNLLIHCFVGASRSVSVAIYYLMKKKNMTLNEAIMYIKNKRYLIHPSETLLQSLKTFENKSTNQ